LDFHLIHKKKLKNYLCFFITILIGILIIIFNGFLTETIRPLKYYWVYRCIIIGIGILLIINANFSLQRFLNKLRIVKSKKNNIDRVLEVYKISYKAFFYYKESIHGNQEIEVKIEYKNWKKIQTKTSYIIS